MIRVIGGRLLGAVAVLWAAYTATFIILFVLPGDPIALMLDPTGTAQLDPARLDAARVKYGFDQPVVVQYVTRLAALFTGDLGQSLSTHRPVAESIFGALPNTVALASAALVLAIIFGALLAVAATLARSRWVRASAAEFPPIAVSLPTFWVGLVLIQIFAFQLGWFPAIGAVGGAALVLPSVALALPAGAVIAQVFTRSIEGVLDSDYIELARAKGVAGRRLFLVHILRNAAVPVLTLTGLVVGGLFAGAVVVETVFSRPGIGRLTEQAVSAHDIPLLQGIVLLAATIFVASNLLVDILVAVIDPRTRGRSISQRLRPAVLAEVNG